ncbi:MAG: class I SAM-dependent methyltransferase [Candidatus Altiarchaeota archaeon]
MPVIDSDNRVAGDDRGINRQTRRMIAAEYTGRLPRIREESGYAFTSSDPRKDLGELFRHKPLIEPTGEEERALRTYYRELFTLDSRRVFDEYIKAYSSPEARVEGHFPGSRREYHEDIEVEFDRRLAQTLGRKGVVRVVDYGAAKCQFISRKKREMEDPSRMHATATTLRYYPHERVDEYVVTPFERMPEGFRGRFDLAVSHAAFPYSPMQHLAVRNMAESLAPGGCGIISSSYPVPYSTMVWYFKDLLKSTESLDTLGAYLDKESGIRDIPKGLSYTGDPKAALMQIQAESILQRELKALEKQGFNVMVRPYDYGTGRFKPPVKPDDLTIGDATYMIILERRMGRE